MVQPKRYDAIAACNGGFLFYWKHEANTAINQCGIAAVDVNSGLPLRRRRRRRRCSIARKTNKFNEVSEVMTYLKNIVKSEAIYF